LRHRLFFASWPETPLTGGAFPSKISQLLIVDALVAAITEADKTRRAMIDITARSVSDRNVAPARGRRTEPCHAARRTLLRAFNFAGAASRLEKQIKKLLTRAISELPIEIEEAAQLDGASTFVRWFPSSRRSLR
jgi:hypothetical protein